MQYLLVHELSDELEKAFGVVDLASLEALLE